MKLTALELLGFKSFAERTRFEFEEGITGIVGPNGCGKSNVFDAVKWALGEQSARSLRGREMLDVIFSGTERRAALGFAEVTLIFDNEDGTLPIDATEVSLTRRLYRSGESQYLVNGEASRLKDMRNLFMGTGLGPGGYSFMEQGKIDVVLAANPADRRRIFEEAAGISRFRARRHETELRLDKVDANLLRISDIVDELERQERSLKIQAGKAQRYHDYQERARDLHAQVALYKFHTNQLELDRLDEELTELRKRHTELVEGRDEQRESLVEMEEDVNRRREALGKLRERMAELTTREQASRDLVAFHQRHLDELESRKTRRGSEIEEAEHEIVQAEEARETLGGEIDTLAKNLETARAATGEKEGRVAELRSEVQGIEEQARTVDTRLQELATQRTDVERRIARLDAEQRRYDDEVQRLDVASREQAATRDALQEERGGLDERLCELETVVEERGRQLDDIRIQRDELETAFSARAASHRELLAELSHVEGRLGAVAGSVERQEGLDEGVKAILEKREHDASFLPGLRGLMIDQFRVEREHADAVEAALGDLSQALCVTTADDAIAGAQFLAERGSGRAAFVILDRFAHEHVLLPAGAHTEDEGVARALSAVLRGISIVESEEFFGAVRSGENLGPVVVATDGSRLRQGGVLVTGHGSDGTGLIALRSELEELRTQTAELAKDRVRLEGELEELGRRRREATERTQELDESHRAVTQELARGRDRHEALSERVARLDQERAEIERTDAAAKSRLAEIATEYGGIAEGLAGLTAELADWQSRRETGRETVESRRTDLDTAVADLEQARVGAAGLEQRVEGARRTLTHLEARLEKATQAAGRFREDLAGYEESRLDSVKSLEEESKRTEELAEETQSCRAEVERTDEEFAEHRDAFDEKSKSARALDKEVETAQTAVHDSDMRSNSLRVKQENLLEHTWEELELDLASMREDYEPAEDVDWTAVEAELDELRRKLGKLGNVNLAAIDDLSDVQERLEFLVAQRDDLITSKQQLRRVLSDIEEESRRLFLETFNNVSEHFRQLFRRLFGGGRADIHLLDEENVLESGIEIVAMPPGKKMQNIRALSGGERTMTAVALLFAIIRAHPSPCCLLDEVDAALDEDNIERFSNMLDEFLPATQFILITHSKRTMAKANVLFGVTMGERGVSRPVGVKFDQVREDGSFETTEEAPTHKGKKRGRGGRGAKDIPPAVDGDTSSTDVGLSGNGQHGGNENGNGGGNGNDNAGGAPRALSSSDVMADIATEAQSAADGGTSLPSMPAPNN